MTAQVNDLFRYRKREWQIAGVSEGSLFEPSLLQMRAVGTCSACWRGYVAVYKLAGDILVLDDLSVNLVEEGYEAGSKRPRYRPVRGPVINGVTPEDDDGFYCNNRYQKLDYRLNYSGGVLIAQDFIQDLYVHMGFHPAWKYLSVVELVFDKGVLIKESDVSDKMAAIRMRFREAVANDKDQAPESHSEIRQWIRRVFDRSYTR